MNESPIRCAPRHRTRDGGRGGARDSQRDSERDSQRAARATNGSSPTGWAATRAARSRGVPTRRYHGVLVPGAAEPSGRMMMLTSPRRAGDAPRRQTLQRRGEGLGRAAAVRTAGARARRTSGSSTGLPVWRYHGRRRCTLSGAWCMAHGQNTESSCTYAPARGRAGAARAAARRCSSAATTIRCRRAARRVSALCSSAHGSSSTAVGTTCRPCGCARRRGRHVRRRAEARRRRCIVIEGARGYESRRRPVQPGCFHVDLRAMVTRRRRCRPSRGTRLRRSPPERALAPSSSAGAASLDAAATAAAHRHGGASSCSRPISS